MLKRPACPFFSILVLNQTPIVMDRKNTLHAAFEYFRNVANRLGSIIVIAAAMIIGFLIGYYYWIMFAKTTSQKETLKLNAVSIAVNERGELMIIDRTNGVYSIYQDSVGQEIFNIYATKKYNQIVK
jgi:hypothetical protein